jgi:hypothetical protein
MIRTRLLLALCAVICAGAALSPTTASASPSGAINGTVRTADTQLPLQGVEACAHYRGEGQGIYGNCDFTDATGEYTIEALAAGLYEVRFHTPHGSNYVTRSYPEYLTVGSGPITGVDVELELGGRLEGTVTEAATGEPLATSVCAIAVVPEDVGGCTGSESSGAYSLTLAAGEYRVEFDSGEGEFVLQYYNHVESWWLATPVKVTAGAATTRIDGAPSRGGEIQGTVRLAAGLSPAPGVHICAWGTGLSGTGRCTESGADGTYAVGHLASDRYKVEFSPGSGLLMQYWNHQPGWNQADEVLVAGEAKITGIDAYLDVAPPPLTLQSPLTPAPGRNLQPCRKGFRKRRVHGRVRCVRMHARHHRHHSR